MTASAGSCYYTSMETTRAVASYSGSMPVRLVTIPLLQRAVVHVGTEQHGYVTLKGPVAEP